MIKTMPNAGGNRRQSGASHPLRLTALLYLKDALRNERYELCGEIIATAREFGASENEIRFLLEDPRRTPG